MAGPCVSKPALQAELASRPEQVRADLALFVLTDENSIRPLRQQPGEIVLPNVQGHCPQILAT
jgi:hypothetical protein